MYFGGFVFWNLFGTLRETEETAVINIQNQHTING